MSHQVGGSQLEQGVDSDAIFIEQREQIYATLQIGYGPQVFSLREQCTYLNACLCHTERIM